MSIHVIYKISISFQLYCPSLGFKGLSHIYSLIRRISSPCIITVLQKVSLIDTVVPFLDMREQKKRVEHFSKCYSSALILHFLLGVHHPRAQRVYALTFVTPDQGVETDSV
jgi:hypothetical protein